LQAFLYRQSQQFKAASFLRTVDFTFQTRREPIHNHGPHELCIIAGGPQKSKFHSKILPLYKYEEE